MRILGIAAAALLLLCALTGCAGKDADPVTPETHPQTDPTQAPTDPEEPQEVYMTDIHRLREEEIYIAVAEEVFTFRSEDEAHFVIQGACFDGQYWYAAAVAQPADAPELTRIIKMDRQGNRLVESDPLPLDHANNLTYNPRLGLLVVTHCQSDDGHYYRYSTVDPDSFEIRHTADLPYPFFAMAYSPELDRYASGEWGGGTLDTWDGDLNPLLRREVEAPGSLSQGVFCDAEGIYFVRSAQNGFSSEIRVYDWQLSLRRTIPIALSGGIEPENINFVDGRVCIVANDWTRRCGVLYALTFT